MGWPPFGWGGSLLWPAGKRKANRRASRREIGPTQSPPLAGDWRRMPPLLMHHGLADDLVRPQQSEHVKAQLEGVGKRDPADFHLETYPRQGHGFTGDALTKSRSATVSFCLKHL